MSNPHIPESEWFSYRDGVLSCEQVSLESIALDVDTPAFVYSGGAIDDAYRSIDEALQFAPHLIAYAVKANGNLSLLARLASQGCGADIVSLGEMQRALKAGFSPDQIVFSGVGKRREEIAAAAKAGIRAIHVENIQELDVVESVAQEAGRPLPIGVRVNPDVDAKTHPYIATGLRESKFGLAIPVAKELIPRIVESPHLELEAVACHIGSQLASPKPLRDAIEILGSFAQLCLDSGAKLRAIDIGGGWPMHYGQELDPYPPAEVFGEAIRDGLEAAGMLRPDIEVITEPGRAIVGDAGVLLTRVLYTKTQGDRRFVIVDAAMTELIRPALYGAYHAIMPIAEPASDAVLAPVDVVGPVCESGDFVARDRPLPPVKPGDLLAIRGAGAYGREMQSMYNARPLPPEVLIDGVRSRVIRERSGPEALWQGEILA
ncbi:MAG: diaminopimelate decarboxylase [Myxococcales bacterium]|nr:diaminopimelate decarboxylase [Myxococcales bacterium]